MTRKRVAKLVEEIERVAQQLNADDLLNAEAALRAYEDILETATVPLVIGNGQQWIAVSDSFAAELGYSAHDLNAVPWSDVLHPQDLTESLRVVEEVIRTGRPGEVVNRYRVKDTDRYRRYRWYWGPPGRHGYTVCVGIKE